MVAKKMMMGRDVLLGLLVLIGLFSLVLCVHKIDSTGDEEEIEERAFSDGYVQQDWRAVDYKPDSQSSWSQEGDFEEPAVPKRRRLRKRKRRPYAAADSDDMEPRHRPRPRPQTLENEQEPWREMEDEEHRPRAYNRRRTGPVYDSKEEAVAEEDKIKPVVYEKVRDPYTALEETKQLKAPPDLKTLLKQSGGSLSLSEILQQKNLSLSDLLKGEQKAIEALTDIPTVATTAPEIDQDSRKGHVYRRLPPSTKRKHNFNDLFTTTTERSAFREQLDAQRKRLAGLSQITKKMRPYHELTTLEVVTEATTERRVFIPVVSATHPKYFNYPSTEETPPTTTVTTTTTTTAAKSTTSSEAPETTEKPAKTKMRLPVTSAKLNKKITAQRTPEPTTTENYPKFTIPPKAFKISLNELFASGEATKENETEKDEDRYAKENGPFKISLDIDELVRKITTERMEIQNQRKNLQKQTQPQENNELDQDKEPDDAPAPEKLKVVTAKDELMEILRDKDSRLNLTKILEKRNMTVAELVAQRERGSSQLHLADIFHKETKEPEPKDAPLIGTIMNDLAFRSFPTFERQGKGNSNFRSHRVEVKKDSQGSSYFTEIVNLKPYSEYAHHLAKKDQPKDITVTSFPTYKISTDKKSQSLGTGNPAFPIPLWKTVYPAKYDTQPHYPPSHTTHLEVKQLLSDGDLTRNEVEMDDLDTKVAEHLNYNNMSDMEDDDYYQLPYGVRSAIIASSAVVGVSLFIFITIFVIFKWSQRQRKRLNYGAYGGSKIRSPILETGYSTKRSGISTIMNATLGRKKNFGRGCTKTGDKQSMADYLWESDKKPFQ